MKNKKEIKKKAGKDNMSANNGLLIKKREGCYKLVEYNASSGDEYNGSKYPTLEEAIIEADKRMKEGEIEYGLRFDFILYKKFYV
jgi:hypothetical protein